MPGRDERGRSSGRAAFGLGGHNGANLGHGHGGRQDPGVLYTADDVVGDLEGTGLEVERAETVKRAVDTLHADRVALDALFRARRAGTEPSLGGPWVITDARRLAPSNRSGRWCGAGWPPPARVPEPDGRKKAMSVRTFVIVGASLAGAKAAETLRDGGCDGRVVLIGSEPVQPYERPPLSKDHLRGESEREKAFVHTEGFYDERRIELLTGTTVTSVDSAGQVTLEDGRRFPFARLLLATGAEPRRLPC